MKIKVLQYTGAMNRGGAETLLMNLYRNINRDKFEFNFISHSKEKSDYDDEIIKLGGKIIYIDKPSIKDLKKFSRDFNNVIKKYGPYDVIHTHVQLFNGFVLKEAAKNNIKIRVSHAHLNGDYSKSSFFRKIYEVYSKYLINKNSTYKISCSYPSGEYLYNGDDFLLLNNAVDVKQFEFDNKCDALKKELKISSSEKIITHIGTFKEAKNHDFIVDVFKRINEKDKSYKLILVGRGQLEDKIKQKVIDNGLDEYVHFLGVREDIPLILQSTDVFFMPSILEGLPVVLVEAQAAGVKCVISDQIPNQCDMGLGLVKSLSLEKDSIEEWAEEVMNIPHDYLTFEKRKNALLSNGFDLSRNIKVISEIYENKVGQ
ncbi:glycosyltransferase [Clostridium perfringens]|uniref:glycosyltransferase n=2 Tax=Clostridium perfringens TaxID=1502 RepID=UPI0018E400C9|nr:glycosyltransferase [Clostridium perfringens]MBI6056662.1 glycosyltransferase [Clostridium perfringens]MDK0550837.1 glycosyltransferase [Clostridium perfringens]